MQTINPQIISGKRVLIRLDVDVPIEKGQVTEDFRLRVGFPTLKLCLKNALKVVVIGHLGRPDGVDPAFSLDPVREWFGQNGFPQIDLLENLRFDPREQACDLGFAEELAGMGDIYINEAFASYQPAASTTILPTLLPHAAGLHFVKEVETLLNVRNNPKKPFVAIMGGAKVVDKLPVIEVLAKNADAVLVGGKLVAEIRAENLTLSKNVLVGKLSDDGFDIAKETTDSWKDLIIKAKMIVWNGPLGKFEEPKNDQSAEIAKLVLASGVQIVVGGGDTVSLLGSLGILEEYAAKGFVSTGGGAMLKLLANGTLPTIEALN